jgi:hypothetical protein
MLLVDALRADYLEHAPFLRDLAKQSAVGCLRECFGFVPRQAYFGGLAANEYGFTNMYCHDPAQSPFRAARALAAPILQENRRDPAGARAQIETLARQRMAPFERSYAGSVQIPLSYLPYFDLVEKFAPWDRRCGYHSLFEILDEKQVSWRQHLWPETNRLPDPSDAGIIDAAILGIDPAERLLCLHLQELDSLGHQFGPESPEVLAAIQATDRHCERLIHTLRESYDDVNLLIFGDHGMVSVTGTLDLETRLKDSGLKFGIDYAYFLDSTMARFWFYRDSARQVVTDLLKAVPGGRLLDPADLERQGIAGCDPRNAELIFLADSGRLILPNFFQAGGDPIPGMHGYDPDVTDNLGLFLVHDTGRPEWAGTALGNVDPPAIFPLLLDLLRLSPADHTSVALPRPLPPAMEPARRFTAHPDPLAEATACRQLDRIVAAVLDRCGPVEAIVLNGSFGRGEGGVIRAKDAKFKAVNDYDLTVIDSRDLRPELAALSSSLQAELGIDFVDLAWSSGDWASLPPTIFNYELRHGSQVIHGEPAVLERAPNFAPNQIPAAEFVRLLINRMAGVLSAWESPQSPDQLPGDAGSRYFTNQLVKLLIAIGDCHLYQWRAYTSSYRRRGERFGDLARGAGLSPALAAAVTDAYQEKCWPGQVASGTWSVARLVDVIPSALQLFATVNTAMTRSRARDLSAALDHYVAHHSSDPAGTKADNMRCRQHPFVGSQSLATGKPPDDSVHHIIMATIPLLLAALPATDRAACVAAARARLAPIFKLPSVQPPDADWAQLRDSTVRAWFAVCH